MKGTYSFSIVLTYCNIGVRGGKMKGTYSIIAFLTAIFTVLEVVK